MTDLSKMTEPQLRHHLKHLDLRFYRVLRTLSDERAMLYAYLRTGKLQTEIFILALNVSTEDMEKEIRIRARTVDARIAKVENLKTKAQAVITAELRKFHKRSFDEWPVWERTKVGNCPWCWSAIWSDDHPPECQERQVKYYKKGE